MTARTKPQSLYRLIRNLNSRTPKRGPNRTNPGGQRVLPVHTPYPFTPKRDSSDEFQDNSTHLPIDPIPKSSLPAPRQPEPPRQLEGADTNTSGIGSSNSEPTSRTRQPAPPSPPSNRRTRTQAGEIDHPDYKKMNSKGTTSI